MMCITCGNPLPYSSFRPRVYCSNNCSDYAKFKNALEKTLQKMKPIPANAKVIKGDMFRLRNIVRNTNSFGVDNV